MNTPRRLPFLLPLLLLALSACAEKPGREQAQFLVFGTLMEVTLWGADAETAGSAFEDLQAMFQLMHRDWHAWNPGPLTELNAAFAAGETREAGPDIVEMIRRSQSIEALSGGCFNPAIGALIGLWGFHSSEFPVRGPPPSREDIEALLAGAPSSADIRIDGLSLSASNPSVQLDFGGVAKGYAVDLAVRRLKELGVENGIVNAGGDLRAFGSRPDRPWRVAVRDPAGGEPLGVIEIRGDEAVFTSGVYERFRADAEERYPHIIDPRTGWPVEEIASVTVIAGEGLLADAAATALIVAGPSGWREVAHKLGLAQVMLIDANGLIHLTPEMAGRVEFAGEPELRLAEPGLH